MQQNLLSIAIPTYNRRKKLQQLIESIHYNLANSKVAKDIELIISDNNSTDSTDLMLKDFSELERSYKFTYHWNIKNLGCDENFGIVIEKSSGKFAWLLGDDDQIEPHSIDFLHNTLSNNQEIGFCFLNYYERFAKDPQESNTSFIAQSDEYIKVSNFENFHKQAMFGYSMISSCVYKKSLFSKILPKHSGAPNPYMYWAGDILKDYESIIIKKPLFTFIHPGVIEGREERKSREEAK